MRSVLISAAFALVTASGTLAAQSPQLKPRPQLPNPLADTVIVSSLALANGAQFTNPGPISLNHVLLGGKKPSHFRASKYADFRDATWVTYPTTIPNFTGGASGACMGSGLMRIVAHFQVRAVKSIGNEGNLTFLLSNIARDTTCQGIGG